ncbi:uncharacterized protein alms1 isoform X2 [Phycodurus eques]|uniref:uncharacterized protein alms1 isoform X2 n=1 Tax=Phycodurus eques TaxID=693459 RepID=UPI002ACD4525|nr:uncharacterized protein alms1 isoform X2 [Phycodurus eques]
MFAGWESAELSDDDDMSVDKVRSFQRGGHTNGKLKSSPPHSHLQFQDSALSPTLALLPANRAGEASVAEYSLFQKSDAEFLPLSACPDFSAGHESDEGSLSQRPLAQESATSEGELTFTPQKVHAVGEAADVGHIASGSRDTQPDAASELLYRQLLSQSNKSTAETSKGETSAPRCRRDGAEESYLGFLPHSRSTPGFLELPSKSAVTSRTLSVIPSSDERSQQVHDGNPCSEVMLSSNATANSEAGASLLASSSVVSSEVENYAAYWTSKPTSPAEQADLNIEERIPLYLQNLGIDQSPADILTAFAPRGPIREPEFSPSDLSTIKDSPGRTPTKSSEAGSPPKGELTDSATSLPSSRGSLPVATRRPPALPNPRSAESSSNRARSSPFAVRSSSGSEKAAEGPACVSSSAKLTVAPPAVEIGDTASPRRAEPEGCSAAPRSPIAVGPPPAADEREPASLPAHPSDASDEEVSLPDGLVPVPEDPEDRSAMSDGSGRSSLTVRVAELLRGGSPAAGVSDRDLPKHKKSFILKLSEGHFDSLELDEEDRRRIEEIKAAMLSNNFVTSESSTDTETTAASGASRPLSDLAGAWTPVLPGAERTYLDAREIAGVDVKAHTSITIAARKRPAPAASSLPPEPLLHAQLDAGNPAAGKSSEEEGGSQNATRADSAGRPEETSRPRHVAEDSTIPFAQVSRAHLTLSPKPPERAPRASTSSSSSLSSSRPTAEPAAHGFVPLSRSSPVVSGTDEGVDPSGPPPQWDGRGWPASALAPPPTPPHHHHHPHHQSVTGSTMRSYTPETPVRDEECAARAPPPALRPYKPRGASELFFLPHAEADASSSCTTVESSHTGLDDAVPPQFPAGVLGQTDPGLDRGVTIKHAEGIYSKKRANALPRSGGAVASDERFPQASQRDASAMERLRSGGGVTREADRWPLAPSDREAWLLEQLQRLSDLILTTGGADAPPARTEFGQTRARTRQPHATACVLCPADRDESSATSSTLDTDRLVRAFGARRILSAKTPKSSAKSAARLHKLYGEVAKQRAQWEGRSFNTPPPSDTTLTETSNATGESSSTGSSYTATPQPRTSKKPLSRGLQAVDVEIVCNATRLRTRDVGTMFPPAGRAVKGQVSSLKHKKPRAPPKLPKAVWWFVPLDDDSKENRPEEEAALEGLQEPDEPEAPKPGPSTVWYDKTAREPLGSRQVDDDDIVHFASSKSGHQVPSLQEALATRRADFISRSRRRVQILRGRKMNGGRLPGGGVPRRAVPRKEMIQRTKRMYERLPEVLRKLEADRREAQNQLNQLNLQIYNKRITKRRLDNRNAVGHEKLW